MKKINRFGVLLGLLAGAGVLTYVPAALAQDAESGPASEMMMENMDISLGGEPPMMPPPIPGMMPGGPMQGAAMMMGGDPSEMLAMHPGGGLMLMHGMGHMSDEQLEKIYQLKSEFMDRGSAKMSELHILERQLHDTLTQPDFDKSKAVSIQNKINGLRDELANLRLEEHIGMLNCLTADQRKELRKAYVRHVDFGMMGGHGGPAMMMHRGMQMHHGGPGGHGGPEGWRGHEGGEHGEHGEHHEHQEHHEHEGGGAPPGTDKG